MRAHVDPARPVIPRPIVRLLARGKPLVPDAAWPLLLTLRSAAGQGPLVGLPAFRTALVVAAHPDDESIGCAGVMALLAEAGSRVTIVYATDGDATIGASSSREETGRRRTAEAREACRLLGVTDVRQVGLPDRGLPERTAELGAAVRRVVDELQPDVVLLPWFLDGHPDHQAVTPALAAAGLDPDLEVWAFETWTPLPANRVVDISSVHEKKAAALAAHVLAGHAFEMSAMLGLSRYRSVHGLMGRGHAEAYLAGTLRDYLALAERVRSAPAP